MTEFKNLSRDQWRDYTDYRSADAIHVASRLGFRIAGILLMSFDKDLLSKVLLDSTRVEYDPIESWLDYITALTPGGVFIPYHNFAQLSAYKPRLQVSRRYRRHVPQLKTALLSQQCDLTQDINFIHQSIQPLVPHIMLNETMTLSALCALKGICFHVSVFKQPCVYPPSPLEKAMWKAAGKDRGVYYELIGAYNQKCPMWLLHFRRSFRGFDA
jgi:hypothetical protein